MKNIVIVIITSILFDQKNHFLRDGLGSCLIIWEFGNGTNKYDFEILQQCGKLIKTISQKA